MEIFSRLKKILFDEVTEEIPVITKEEKKNEENARARTNKAQEEVKKRDRSDSVIIEKIETPKREKRFEERIDDEPFDMPKLKEEAKKEVKKSTFTFPVFGDEEKDLTSRRREHREESRRPDREERRKQRNEIKLEEEKPVKRDSVGYTNAFDYSYGKYKGDYKASREQAREMLTKTLEQKEEHKAFTPSPIISPVWGVLNENYKKEDIVSKKDEKRAVEPLDLDSVRRKAYGTLEEEIEVSLGRDIEPKVEEEPLDEDEGISIDDLLVDKNGFQDDEEKPTNIDENDEESDADDILPFGHEEDEVLDEIIPVIDEDEEALENDIENDFENIDVEEEPEQKKEQKKEKSVPPISALSDDEDTSENIKEEKTVDKNEPIGEEDLFDLIESIYERKGEE